VLPEGYEIRELRRGDAGPLAEAYRRNVGHLAPWDPLRPERFYTEQGQAEVICAQLAAVASGTLVAWVIGCGERLVGRINLNNIVRGALWSGALGYWVDAEHQGRGLATAAVQVAVHGARARGLHRVEASTLVRNAASQQVLRKCGFEQYGLAPQYLFIAGEWQDHLLFQRILHDEPV
jgi:[ribosomal protein S5]-alanine N-acetyltransferase